MKYYLSRLLAFVLVVAIALGGCSANPAGLTGNYPQDTLNLVNSMRSAIEMPEDSINQTETKEDVRQQIYTFAARYRRERSLTTLTSYTTMRTAMNSLAGHYSFSPERPVPNKLKDRLQQEFKQIEAALKRES